MTLNWDEARFVINGRGKQHDCTTSLREHVGEAKNPAAVRKYIEITEGACAAMLEALEEWERDQV